MATVADILAQKGTRVFTIDAEATVFEAADLMNEHRIGAVVVTQDGRVAGIFSERDVLERVVTRRLDPATTTVGQVMTRGVICCQPETPIDEARSVCKNRRIRHLPVGREGGEIEGLISIGDLNAHHTDVQESTIYFLRWYLYQYA